MKFKLVHFKPKLHKTKPGTVNYSIGLLPVIGMKEKRIPGLSPYKYGERFNMNLILSELKRALDLGKEGERLITLIERCKSKEDWNYLYKLNALIVKKMGEHKTHFEDPLFDSWYQVKFGTPQERKIH